MTTTTKGLELTFYLDGKFRLIGQDTHSGSPTQEQLDSLLEKSVGLYGEDNFMGYDSFTFHLSQKTDTTFGFVVECYEDGQEDPSDEEVGTLTL